MNEREKSILERLSDTVPTLDKEKQNYLVGFVEGMAIAKEKSQESREENAICVS